MFSKLDRTTPEISLRSSQRLGLSAPRTPDLKNKAEFIFTTNIREELNLGSSSTSRMQKAYLNLKRKVEALEKQHLKDVEKIDELQKTVAEMSE